MVPTVLAHFVAVLVAPLHEQSVALYMLAEFQLCAARQARLLVVRVPVALAKIQHWFRATALTASVVLKHFVNLRHASEHACNAMRLEREGHSAVDCCVAHFHQITS